MSESDGFRRLVLDIGHGAADAAALRAAEAFARLLGVELHCVFIEDEAVLALAGLPFAREYRLPTHDWSPIDASALAAELRHAAVQARQLLDRTLGDDGVPRAFEVLRGEPAACLAGLCRTDDIVVRVGPQARGAAPLASCLLLPRGFQPRGGAVVAVMAGDDDPALEVACRIAAAAGDGLMVLAGRAVDEASVRARAVAAGVPVGRVVVRCVAVGKPADILSALGGMREQVIVMARPAAGEAEVAGLFEGRRVPMLLI